MTTSSSTSIRASWQLPPADSRNGIITGFKLFYRQKHSDNQPKLLNISSASIRAETVRELMKFTEYEFQLLAYTLVGNGPNSSVQFAKTMEDGKWCHLKLMSFCEFSLQSVPPPFSTTNLVLFCTAKLNLI